MSRKSIVKNTAFMTFASIGQKIVAFVYFTLIARTIGVEDTGKYFLALSFTTVFVVFVDLGFTNVLVREAAKFKEKTQEYFSNVLSVKILFGILAYIGLIITVNLLDYSTEIKQMIYISGLTMMFDSLHLTIYGVLRAIGNLKYEAISIVVSQTITLILGSIFLFLHFPLYYLILAFTIPSFLNAVYAGIILSFKYKLKLKPVFNKKIFFHIGKIAIPFALAAVFARLYSYIDSIIMSKLADETIVGYYSVPYKITYAFQFLPLALVAALYPRFSEFFIEDKQKLQYIFQQGLKYLLIIVFPISIGIFVLAPEIITSIYTSEYEPSILPLRILILSLIFSYLSFPIGAFLNACNRQITQTVIVGIVLITNVILNLILIPQYGASGAAFAAFVGNFLLTLIGYFIIPKIIPIDHGFFLKNIGKLLLSVTIMGLTVFYINIYSNFLIAILGGAIIYPIMIYATQTVKKSQLFEIIGLFKK